MPNIAVATCGLNARPASIAATSVRGENRSTGVAAASLPGSTPMV
jgi:hypothetical protein